MRRAWKRLLVKYVPILVVLLGIMPVCAKAQTGWFSSSWLYRNPVTISNTAGTNLSNFQLKVTLGSTFNFSEASSGGSDVRVTASDGVTAVPFWIENWNATAQTASVWVQIPSLPASGATIYIYYGNPSAASVSNGDTTFLFFDDFNSNQTSQGYWSLGAAQTELVQDQSWETSAPHTLSVLQLNRGGHTYWGYYALQAFSCGGVGLAWSEDLVNWTKDTSNPLFTNGRWPRVMQVGGTLYMVYTYNYCGNSQINLASSTDGINWTIVKTLVPAYYGNLPRNQNPDFWLNPNDGRYYLYWYNGNDSGRFNIMSRSADSPVNLDNTSTDALVLSSTTTLAAPDMFYYNGTYFLSTEATDANGLWETLVYASTMGPTSGFSLLPGNPVMNNGAACMFQTPFGTTLHEYFCQLTGNTWTLQHRAVDLTSSRIASPIINSAKWTPTGGNWSIVQDTRPYGTTGYVAQATASAVQILRSSFTGTNYIAEMYGKQLAGTDWGLGFRTSGASNLYSINLYDNHNGAPNLYSYLWSSGAATTLGSASVGTVNPNTWYKLGVRASGNGFDVYKDDVFQFHTSDSTFASGGVGPYGESGTVANFANVLVRQYAVADPTSSVGAQQVAAGGGVASLMLNPATVLGGVANSTATVTLATTAPQGGAAVALSSSNTGVATVPATVVVPANSNSATFNVTSSAVAVTTGVNITATFISSQSATLTVNPPSVISVTLNPNSAIGGLGSSTATVALSGPAPTGGLSVSLNSSNTAVATVPPSIVVPGGAVSTTFTVSTNIVAVTATSTISATFNGTASAMLTVNPGASVAPTFVRAAGNSGQSAKYTVTISPAPGDFLVVFVWQTEGALTPTSVTDNLANTYTRDCDLATLNQGFGNRRLTVYHLQNAPSGITGVSVTPNKPSRAIVAEYSGMPLSGAILDACGAANNQATRTTSWSSPATTTTQTDLVFGLVDSATTAAAGYAPGTGWNGRLAQADAIDVNDSYVEDAVAVSPSTYTATGTSTASATESTVVVAYKVSSGPAAPVITSANNTTFTAGAAGTFTMTATGTTPITFAETGALPSGVSLSPAGVLGGTPGLGTLGVYPITVTASNGVPPNAAQSFTLTVGQAPIITSVANTTFTVGTPGAFTLTATGSPAPTFAETGTLPSGVTLSTSGVLAGTPAAGTGGSYSIAITASNGATPNATQTFTLTVNQAPAITSAASATLIVGTAGSFTVTASGFPAPTLTESGSLPAGVTFNPTTNILSGTPAAGTAGAYPITFTAQNGVGSNATQSFTLTISAQSAGAAFVRVAGNRGESVPYTVGIAPATGDFLAVFIWQIEGAANPVIADNKGSAYILDCNLTYNQGFGVRRLTVYHLLKAGTGITGVTVNPNTPSRAIVAEYSGMASTAGLDVCGAVNNQNTNVNSWASPLTLTLGSKDLIFGLADSAVTSAAGYRASGSWNGRLEQPDTADTDDSYLEDQLNVAAGSYTAAGTSNTAARESTVIVGFRVQ